MAKILGRKHIRMKKRINIEAEKLGQFSTDQLLSILNNYPNMHGYGVTVLTISKSRLTNFLRANPNISTKEKLLINEKNTWVWKQ
tara:strand:- start:1816 stop:2070 length:255 start_codon:yes stop_codon:yes gene_type:complete